MEPVTQRVFTSTLFEVGARLRLALDAGVTTRVYQYAHPKIYDLWFHGVEGMPEGFSSEIWHLYERLSCQHPCSTSEYEGHVAYLLALLYGMGAIKTFGKMKTQEELDAWLAKNKTVVEAIVL